MSTNLTAVMQELRILSGSTLKMLALALMTADHIGAFLLSPSNGITLRLIGRMAFPIFAFLLAEGYSHTANPKRYAGRLLLLALLSEVPMDLMMTGTPWNWDCQNIMWTLLLGLTAMYAWDNLKGIPVLRVAAPLAITGMAWVINADYLIWGAFLPLLFHLLRTTPPARLLSGAALSQNSFQACSYIFIALYNGQRGFIRGKWKWACYFYYPVHMLAIWAAAKTFGLP